MVGNKPLYGVDACLGIKPDDFELIADQGTVFVMPIKAQAVNYLLDDQVASCLIIAVGLMPENWSAVPAPHFIPISGTLGHAMESVIDTSRQDTFSMLNNLCILLTMMGKDVYYPKPSHKKDEFITASYSPMFVPESFAVVNPHRCDLKEHINQKILDDDMSFYQELKDMDQQMYEEIRQRVRNARSR